MFFLCFNSSLGKLLFILLELCWQTSDLAHQFASFDVPCSPYTWTVALVIVGVSGFSYHWWNWHIAKSCWRALISIAAKIGEQWSCQVHTHPGNVFFSRNMEKPLVGKGGGRQTNWHFRGGKIWSLCAFIFVHFQFYWFTSAGLQRRSKGEEKELDLSVCGNTWVMIDGS